MNDVKERLRQHYDGVNLSKARLAKLEAMVQGRSRLFLDWRYYAMVSLATVVAFLIYVPQSGLQKIAEEVAYNHKKNLPSEFLADEIVELNSKLVKLDFKLKAPSALSQYTVIGGRYCSIQGRAAAQIKIKFDKKMSTLYESDFLDIPKENLPYRSVQDGVEVVIWIEDNILFAKATDI